MAAAIDAEIRSLPVRNTPSVRNVRRKYSRQLKQAPAGFILELARELLKTYGQRWVAYELIRDHEEAFQRIGEAELEELGQGIDSWGSVDAFARTLAGPLWLRGRVSDGLIHKWAQSDDRWWRRAAL
ncbi:MAG TPA: DNA alkylation repair protein, partial [Anaerolineae bacterium]